MTTSAAGATKWPGTTEERELRRVQKVGDEFMTEFRAGKHTDAGDSSGWLPFIKKRTRLRDRWIWADKHLPDQRPELERLRAEVAGTIMVESFADGSNSVASVHWFEKAAAQDEYAEGWYFDDECMLFDGWEIVEGTTKDDPPRKWTGWRKKR